MGERGRLSQKERAVRRAGKLPVAGPDPAVPRGHPLLRLQRLAGNQAVTRLLTTLQRQPHNHPSAEHSSGQSAEQSADQQAVEDLLSSLGSLRRRGQAMIRFAHDTGIPGRDIRAAVDAAAFDETPTNRLQAANVYVIGRAAGHPATAAIASGEVRVHAIDTMPPGVTAAYVAVDTPPLLHDTIYVQPSFGVDDLGTRSVVIHELQHAEQDRDPAHAVDPGQHLSKGRAEWEAYRTQARYLVSQLEAVTGAARQDAVAQAARSLDLHVSWMLLLEVQNDRARLQPLIAPLFDLAPPPLHMGSEQLDQLLSLQPGTLRADDAGDGR